MKNWQVIVIIIAAVTIGTSANVWYARRASINVTRHIREVSSESEKSFNQRLGGLEKSLADSASATASDTLQAVNARLNEVGSSLGAQIQSASSNTSAETAKRLEALERSLNARLDALGVPKVASSIPRDLNVGLVAYYPFNGNANDASGNGNNGTPVGAMLTTDRFGTPNSAYYFNGVDQYIQIKGSPSLSPTSAVSFCAWIAHESKGTGNGGYVVKKGVYLVNGTYVIGFPDAPGSSAWVTLSGDSAQIVSSSQEPVLNQWSHVAGVYDGASLSIYVNGELVTSKAASGMLQQNSYPLYLGGDYNNPASYFKGKIDDVRIYNRALSTQEIQILYALRGTL